MRYQGQAMTRFGGMALTGSWRPSGKDGLPSSVVVWRIAVGVRAASVAEMKTALATFRPARLGQAANNRTTEVIRDTQY